jgi:uncharacterized protein YjbJ (UPF0337 family)
MNHRYKDSKYASDKFTGKVEIAAGKLTGNQQLELKGHVKVAKAEIKHKLMPKHVIDDLKEKAASVVNKKIDAKKP